MRWARIGIVGAFLLAAISSALAGSTARPDGEAAREPVPESAPPDLSASAEIRRSFIEEGTVAIAVTNHGDAPVRVRGVELRSDSFAPLGKQDFDTTVPPSINPRDLIIEYGAAVCPEGIESTAAPSSVALTVETEDGATHEVTAGLSHANGTLDRLLREDCEAAFVQESVEVTLGGLTEDEDGTLEGTLTLTPTGEASVEVTEVRGSVLFAITAGEASGSALPVRFDAHRCQGHAVGDAKQPFAFYVWVAIDGGEPVAAPIPVGREHQDALWSMLEVRCGCPGD